MHEQSIFSSMITLSVAELHYHKFCKSSSGCYKSRVVGHTSGKACAERDREGGQMCLEVNGGNN